MKVGELCIYVPNTVPFGTCCVHPALLLGCPVAATFADLNDPVDALVRCVLLEAQQMDSVEESQNSVL